MALSGFWNDNMTPEEILAAMKTRTVDGILTFEITIEGFGEDPFYIYHCKMHWDASKEPELLRQIHVFDDTADENAPFAEDIKFYAEGLTNAPESKRERLFFTVYKILNCFAEALELE